MIRQRIYYYLELENISPIHIGNGNSDMTDLDVITDKKGNFFIPGTSIAGSIVHYLTEDQKAIILPEYKNQNKQSPLFISDARLLKSESMIENRDGIKLDENKITIDGAKYDYQVVPANRKFQLLMEITDYDGKEYEDIMEDVFSAINNHDITVGYKTTRGLGKLKINKAGKKVFNKDNIKDYFKFNRYSYSDYQSMDIEVRDSSRYDVFKVKLKQNGGIIIKVYNTSKTDVDHRHIHSNDKPVIPGTSWNGLIRKTLNEYIQEQGLDLDLTTIFGDAGTDKKIKSKIYIGESRINNGYKHSQTRNRINPFHGGTVEGALYSEESYYHGETELVIALDKQIKDIELLKQLIMLFILDLSKGFIALGGETSIGRGLFDVLSIQLNNKEVHIKDYIEMEE